MAAIGIDLGGTKIQALRVEGRHDAGDGLAVTGSARVPTPRVGGADAVVDAIVEAVLLVGTDDVTAIGCSFAGPVDHRLGVALAAPNVADLRGTVPLAAMLRERLGVHVAVENDVNAGTWGEHVLGAGRGCRDLAGVFPGTGVGGGLVLDGVLRRGPHGTAGEVGHMVIRDGGRTPASGLVDGTVEAYAGRATMEATARRWRARGRRSAADSALFTIAQRKGRDRLTSGTFRKAWDLGDRTARRLVAEAERALAVAIASLHNALDLEVVVLGGGMAEAFGDGLRDRVDAQVRELVLVPHSAPELRCAELGDLAGALGAMLIATGDPTGERIVGRPVA